MAGMVHSAHQHWREPDQIEVFDLVKRRSIAKYELPKPAHGAKGSEFAKTAALSPEGSAFLTGDGKGVFQRNILTGEIERGYAYPNAPSITLNKDSMTVSVDAGSAKKELAAVNYSNDGQYVLAAYEDDTVYVWDAGSGRFIKELLEGREEIGLCGQEDKLGKKFVSWFTIRQFVAMSDDNRSVVAGKYGGSLMAYGFDGRKAESYAKFSQQNLTSDLSCYLGSHSEESVELVKLCPARRAARFTALSISDVASTPDMGLIVAVNSKETFILKAENLDGAVPMTDSDNGADIPISKPVTLSLSAASAPEKGAESPKTAEGQNVKNTKGFFSRIFRQKKV
jgi:WD40 repeat protein